MPQPAKGVGDMDRGARIGHRGQNALLVLVDDFQRGRQGSEEVVANSAAHGIPDTPVAGLACHTQSRADRATKRSLRMPQRHERRDGRPGVVQDQNNGLAEVIRGWCEDQTAGHTVRPWGVLPTCKVPACQTPAGGSLRPRRRCTVTRHIRQRRQVPGPVAVLAGKTSPRTAERLGHNPFGIFGRNMATQGAV